MTIRELERRSGLERTNIRFYEKEGLLNPERKENGYREYSEEDLQLLMKIKLLRRLDFSIEAIRSLIKGNTDLEQALERRLQAIEMQHRELNATEQVCQEMKADRVDFSTLDAQRYLDNYDRALQTPSSSSIRPTVPQSDRIQPVRCPWRRYFARMLDISILSFLYSIILILAFRVNLANLPAIVDWLLGLLDWALLIPAEGFLLSRWGTTPGKWIMGIRIEHEDGRKLTFGEAAERTWLVFVKGVGATVPLYNIYRLWKSYKAVGDGNSDDLEWEWSTNSVQIVREQECPAWRKVVWVAVNAVGIFLAVVIAAIPAFCPVNRGGELTVDEFVENYNAFARYYGYEGAKLQTDGTYGYRTNTTEGEVVVDALGTEALVLHFEETDDVLTGVSFERKITQFFSGPDPDAKGQQAVLLSAMSYAWADCSISDARRSQEILEQFTGWHEGHVEENFLNCRLTYTVERGEDTRHEGGAFWEENYTARFELVPLD